MKTSTKQQYSVAGNGARRSPAAAVPFILRGRGLLGASFPRLARRLGTVALVALGALTASAQPYAIEWFAIAGGGGVSTGGVYSVSGTLGQSAAGGPLSGGSFSLTSGFSSIYAVQTPGAPTLTILPAGPGLATISWTPATSGFVLQTTLSLSPPNWTDAPSGAANPITVPATQPVRFYRLKQTP